MPMTYDPFRRGVHPVGVRSSVWQDSSRDVAIDVEIWYPAIDDYIGQDLQTDTQDEFVIPGLSGEEGATQRQRAVRDAQMLGGRFNAVLLSHGFAGHRRESTFMGTHLASHGFLVVSADHIGSTHSDIDEQMSLAKREGRHDFSRADIMPALIEARCADVPFMVDAVIGRFDVDEESVGITGASFGGWTSLMAPSLDARIKASAPMCPSGGDTPTYPKDRNVAREALDLRWKTQAPVMFMVADRDTWLPLYGEIELFRRAPSPKRLFVLEQADHNHFIDNVEAAHEWLLGFTESLADVAAEAGSDWRSIANQIQPFEVLCSEETAHMCWRGLCAAHMDAYLRSNKDALEFWQHDVLGTLAEREINVMELRYGEKA